MNEGSSLIYVGVCWGFFEFESELLMGQRIKPNTQANDLTNQRLLRPQDLQSDQQGAQVLAIKLEGIYTGEE